MSLNTSHTPDGKGVLIYNGEVILLYSPNTEMKFKKYDVPAFKSSKSGALYLTTHRIIFMSDNHKHDFKSFAMPFHCLRDVKLEQPILAPNYLKGWVQPLPGGNFDGCPEWRLSFPKGGCIEFGQTLLTAARMASESRPFAAPPAYAPTTQGCPQQQTYYSAAPAYYLVQGNYQGFQPPTHVFPEQPPAGNVYIYDSPPPYPGIGQTTPYPAGQMQAVGVLPPYPGQQQQGVAPPYPGQQQPGVAPPYPGQQPPQAGFVFGQGAAPSGSTGQPPAYSAYQDAGPLPQKNGPPM